MSSLLRIFLFPLLLAASLPAQAQQRSSEADPADRRAGGGGTDVTARLVAQKMSESMM